MRSVIGFGFSDYLLSLSLFKKGKGNIFKYFVKKERDKEKKSKFRLFYFTFIFMNLFYYKKSGLNIP